MKNNEKISDRAHPSGLRAAPAGFGDHSVGFGDHSVGLGEILRLREQNGGVHCVIALPPSMYPPMR